MPRAYYQCPVCRKCASTTYSGGYDEPPEMQHNCLETYEYVTMTFRGNGYEGRDYYPHGRPGTEEGEEAK